mmetsp:Transcript_25044/g.78056  ORF Transcript_25044/g.78056 Transcript_25044/m.78056 type:complete len:87 (-) Transcript_25044:610-870(-)
MVEAMTLTAPTTTRMTRSQSKDAKKLLEDYDNEVQVAKQVAKARIAAVQAKCERELTKINVAPRCRFRVWRSSPPRWPRTRTWPAM